MREQLLGYIAFFPGNTLLPSLLAWKETRLGIDDRVRSVLDGVVFAPAPATAATAQPGCGTGGDGVATRAFAIRHEARTGNSHMVRAAFERALAAPTTTDNNPCCREHHPGLWTAYVRFCSRHDAARRARDAFYRALSHCPWSRDVMFAGMGVGAGAGGGGLLDADELRSVYHTLCDKGLRVHVEMPEFIERWGR